MPLFLFLVPLLIPFVFKSTQKVVPTRLFFSLWYHFLQSLPLASQIFPAKYTNTTAQKLQLSQNSALTVSLSVSLSIYLCIYISLYLSISLSHSTVSTDFSEKPPAQLSYLFQEYTASTPLTFRRLSPAIFRGFPVLISHHIPPESLCKSFPCP